MEGSAQILLMSCSLDSEGRKERGRLTAQEMAEDRRCRGCWGRAGVGAEDKPPAVGEVTVTRRSARIRSFGGVEWQVRTIPRDFLWEWVAEVERKSLKIKGCGVGQATRLDSAAMQTDRSAIKESFIVLTYQATFFGTWPFNVVVSPLLNMKLEQLTGCYCKDLTLVNIFWNVSFMQTTFECLEMKLISITSTQLSFLTWKMNIPLISKISLKLYENMLISGEKYFGINL